MKSLSNKWVHLAVICLLTFFAYSNIFSNQFVGDDASFIVDWPVIRDWGSAGRVFLGENVPLGHPASYRPIRTVLLAFIYHFWGINPWGYHLFALGIHLINTLLVYLIVVEIVFVRGSARRFSRSTSSLRSNLEIKTPKSSGAAGARRGSPAPVTRSVVSSATATHHTKSIVNLMPFFVALLFGLHPIHVEAVTYTLVGIANLSSIFFFASIWLYLKFRRGKGAWHFYFASVILAVLAFFTYDITLTLPALIVLCDLCLGYLNWKNTTANARYYLAYFAGAGLYFLIRNGVVHVGLSMSKYLGDSQYHSLILIPKIVVWYIFLLVLPLKLSFMHTIEDGVETYQLPYSKIESVLNKSVLSPDILASILLILVICAVGIWFLRKRPVVTMGIFWFLIALAPVSGIFPIGAVMSERYIYLASFGFILVLVYLIALMFQAKNRYWRQFAVVFCIILTLFYFVRTYVRNMDWRDGITLWASVIREYPKSLIGHYNLALYQSVSNVDAAIGTYNKLIGIEPKFLEARVNLANAYSYKGELDKAKTEYEEVIRLDPSYVDAYVNLAGIADFNGKDDLALEQLVKAVNADGGDNNKRPLARAYNLQGTILVKQGRFLDAAESFSKAFVNLPADLEIKASIENLIGKKPQTRGLVVTYPLKNGNLQLVSFGNYTLEYPANWKISERQQELVISDSKGDFTVRISFDLLSGEETPDKYLALQTVTSGKLINQGPAKIPNVASAYVKIWDIDGLKQMQFFLFGDGKVVKVLVNNADSVQMAGFEQILGSVIIQN